MQTKRLEKNRGEEEREGMISRKKMEERIKSRSLSSNNSPNKMNGTWKYSHSDVLLRIDI